jgi:hypothetical protein
VKKLIPMMLLLTVAVSAGAADGPLEERLDNLNQQVSKVDIDREQLEKVVPLDIQEKVDQIVSLYHSPAYQQKLKQEQVRIRAILGIEGQEEGGEGIGSLKGLTGRSVYVFASSSVPLRTLRNYAAGMVTQEGYAPVMVFCGFVDGAGKIGPTVKLIGDIIKVDSGCDMTSGQCDTWPVSVTVDPMKFRQFGIQKVPAIVLDRGEKKDPLILYGDVSLKYALERFESEVKEGS